MNFHIMEPPSLRADFEQLEQRRSEIGIPVAELCRKADLSASTYWLLQKSKTRNPAFRTLTKLKQAMTQLERGA